MKLKETIGKILAIAMISYVVATYVHQDKRPIHPEMLILYSNPKVVEKIIPLGTDVNVFKVAMALSGMEDMGGDKPLNPKAVGRVAYKLDHYAWWHFWGTYWVWVIAQYDENNKIVEINVSTDCRGF